MIELRPTHYWLSPQAIYIRLNAMGNADYIQANVVSGAMIMAYAKDIKIDGKTYLDFDAAHNYRRWPLLIFPTFFKNSAKKYVYVAIPKDDSVNAFAKVVFPDEKIDLYGCNEEGVQIGPTDHLYIFTQGIISASSVNGVLQERTWEQRIDTGSLASDEAIAAGGIGTWFEYNSIDDTITFLKEIAKASFQNINVRNLFFGNDVLTGLAKFPNTDIKDNKAIATAKYVYDYVTANFLSKKNADTAQSLITFLQGIKFSNAAKIDGMGNAFLKSIQLLGSERFLNGFGVWLDDNGRAHGQIDFLHVFGKAIFNTVEIRELSHVGGDIGLSKASGKIIKVVKVEKGWKCYLKTDDGTIFTFNGWKCGDQAKCQTFNLRKGITNNAANRYYWRCVEEVAEKTDTEEAYIVLSNVEHFFDPMGTDEPREGDTLVLCGHNRTWDLTHGITESDTSRMNFTQITTSKEEGGTIEVYRNIQDFKMTLGNAIFHLSSEKLYVNTNSLVWLSGGGEQVANMLFRGDWYKGVVAYKNEVWYSKGEGWLSLTDNNTDEPTASSPNWQCRIQKGKDGGTGLRVEGFSSPNSSFYAEGQTSWKATYELHVWHNDKEITNELPSTRFVWERYSDYTQGDEAWNATHKNVGYKINVTYEDLKGDTTFICKLMSEDGNNIITSRTF